RYSNQLLAGPDIVSRGFVSCTRIRITDEDARRVVSDALDDCLSHNISDWSKIKNVIRDSLGDFLWKQTKRISMILPIIMEV
ncbi:MAG: ribonuclease J, partial [Coprococcus sp.]